MVIIGSAGRGTAILHPSVSSRGGRIKRRTGAANEAFVAGCRSATLFHAQSRVPAERLGGLLFECSRSHRADELHTDAAGCPEDEGQDDGNCGNGLLLQGTAFQVRQFFVYFDCMEKSDILNDFKGKFIKINSRESWKRNPNT